MGMKLNRNYAIVIMLAAVLLTAGLTGCTGEISAATDGTDGTQQTLDTTAQAAATDTVARPEGWSEETHGKGTEPNYDVVFPDDKVNQITIIIDPEDWEAMQANLVDLFGEAGSGGDSRGLPGGFEPPDGIDTDVDEVAPGLTVFDRMVEWIHAALFKPGCLRNSQGGGHGNTCTF